MTQPTSSKPYRISSLAAFVVIGLAIVIGFIAIIYEDSNPFTVLLTGWSSFMFRVFPRVRIRWDGIAFVLIFLLLATIVAHSVFSWLYQFHVSKSEHLRNTKWRLRSTGVVLMMVLALFAIGISFSGIVHQTGWVMRSPSPWYEDKSVQSQEDARLSGFDSTVVENQRRSNWVEGILVFLPHYVEYEDYHKSWNDPINSKKFKNYVEELLNPSLNGPFKSRDGYGLGHFAGNKNIFAAKHAWGIKEFKGGTSRTLMVGECNAGFVPWPSQAMSRDFNLGIREDWSKATPGKLGFGPTGNRKTIMVVMVDGSTQELATNIDPKVLSQMSSPKRVEE